MISKPNNLSSRPIFNPCTSALYQLLSPDGYYHYLSIPKCSDQSSKIDHELIRKSYRRLSLKHHPDRPSGDAETFHLLYRAKKVLLDDILRKQYDLLGFDLEDDEDGATGEDMKKRGSLMTELAGLVLSGVGSLCVRTLGLLFILASVSSNKIVIICVILCLVVMFFRSYMENSKNKMTIITPLVIIGIIIYLHIDGSRYRPRICWISETLLQMFFIQNAIPFDYRTSRVLIILFIFLSFISLYTKGNPYQYIKLILSQLILAVVILIFSPVLELVVEEIVKEKMGKVGERLRSHLSRMERIKRGWERD